MLPVEINQIDKGIDRVITVLKEKENFKKLLEIFTTETQELEEQNILLADQKNIAIAEGEWLNFIGLIVGEDRQGKNDVDYRSAINTRIGINTSDATPNNIISLTKQHTGSSSSKIIEYYPASFFSVVTGSVGLDTGLFDLVQGTKPAGVSAEVVSNLGGTRFLPAWLNSASQTTVEDDFLLDAGDELLFDDGLDPLDFLEILIAPEDIFATDPDLAILAWIEETPFEVNNAGNIEPLDLSVGGTLTVVTVTPPVIPQGLLAQVITQDTIAL